MRRGGAPAGGPLRRDRLFAVAIAVWALVGVFAARAPWHEVRAGPFEAKVRGVDRWEGKALGVALGGAAFLAGYTLLAAGPLLARTIALCAAAAVASAGRYLHVLRNARATIRELAGEATKNAEGGLLAGAIVAAAAAAATLALASAAALARWQPSRGQGTRERSV